MSKDFSLPGEGRSVATAAESGAESGGSSAIRIALRLHPVDHSDRALLANVSAARSASSLVLIDFGFIEPHALVNMARDARAGNLTDSALEGRLECRIAMSRGDARQLTQQLQGLLTSPGDTGAQNHAGDEVAELFSLDTSANLQ